MSFPNPFIWLRRQAAEAVVLGTADGLRALAPEGEPVPANLDELRALLAASVQPAKQLPAPADDEPKKGRARG